MQPSRPDCAGHILTVAVAVASARSQVAALTALLEKRGLSD